MNTATKPFEWKPYSIVGIEVQGDRTGYIGRAAAFRHDGIEMVVLCRNVDELARVGDELTGGNFDANVIYKGTLINTEGVEVLIPDPEPEVTIPPVVEEQPAAPQIDADPISPLELDTEAFMQATEGAGEAVTTTEDDEEL